MNRREFLRLAGGAVALSMVPTLLLPNEAAALYSSYGGNYFDKALHFIAGPERVGGNVPGFHFPHFLHAHEQGYWIWAYFIDHNENSPNDVGLARSKDGKHFDYVGKVLRKGDEFDNAQASFADVAHGPDGRFHMLYEGKRAEGDINSVCWAVSNDGIHWDKRGPVIVPDNREARNKYGDRPNPGRWGNIDVGTPTLAWDCGRWNVYYHMFAQDGRVRMGYAWGDRLDALQCKQGPILDVFGEPWGIDSGTIGCRANIVNGLDGYRYMFHECSTFDKWGANRFETCWWGSSVARAKDYEGPWEKWRGGAVLPNPKEDGPGGLHRGMGFEISAVLQDGDKLWLYYRTPANETYRVAIEPL